MANAGPNGTRDDATTLRQRMVRHRARRLSLRRAVRMAAGILFQFTHRAANDRALWSKRERVWLGSQTFLHWAMCDDAIDIPRLVGGVTGAPEEADAFDEAVRAELLAYWDEQMAALPQKSKPGWMALP